MAKNGSITEIRKKITKTHELISTSFHEAGHTVYALLHLLRVSQVSIFEDKKVKRINGSTEYNYPFEFDHCEDQELLKSLLIIEISECYAGLIAEKTLFKSISGSTQIPMFIIEGAWVDNKDAANIIKKYNLAPAGNKRYLFKQKIMRQVQSELFLHWNAVIAVAHALFKHKKLSYDDLKQILLKKSHNKQFWKEQFKKIDNYYGQATFEEAHLKSIL